MNIRSFFYTIYFISGLGVLTPAMSQTRPFVQEDVVKVAGATTVNEVYSLSATDRNSMRSYYDGSGRLLQVIAIGASPTQKDVIQPVAYDQLGRQTRNYLPYAGQDNSGSFRQNALNEQAGFYNMSPTQKVAVDATPYSQQIFENSPLQRLMQSGSVGAGFQPGQRYTSMTYGTNQVTETIRRWDADGVPAAPYAAGTLSVVTATDEEGVKTSVYTDNNGRSVLKKELLSTGPSGWLETYYVYDEAGQLIYAVPPKAVTSMTASGNYSLTQAALSGLLFRYAYDNRGRQIERTVPGAGVVYLVYDPLDRLVLAQDANLRAKKSWNYIKYDIRNTPISQGIYLNTVQLTRGDMQTYVSGLNYGGLSGFEERGNLSTTGFYTNRSFPNINNEALSFSYYDDYDMDGNGVADYSYQVQGLSGEAQVASSVHSRMTMLRKRTVGAGLNNLWLVSAIFYDSRGNVIQTQANNHVETGALSSTTIVSDFVGKPSKVKTIQRAAVYTSVLSEYSYDHQGRVKTVDETYNGAAAIRVAAYEYNEIGQLIDKKLHSTNGGASYLQSLDYRYTIRGQISSINNSTLTVDDKNDDTDDVFGMEVFYDKTDASVGNTGYYNGQMSAVKWKVKAPGLSTANERKYVFSYDKLKRLQSALYADRASTTSAWGNAGGFDEKNLSYDANGNILTLQRNALVSGAVTGIDELNYSYDGNRLTNVTDGSGGSYGLHGFKNPTGSVAPYTYDENGNLLVDAKKGLIMDYNVLNRTDKITITGATGRYINYTYDATGVLIRKRAFDNNVLVTTTDYINGFVYENNVLQYFGMAEGRVRNAAGVLTSEYMIKDPQGNVRVSFEKQGNVAVVRQENSYYPYGLRMPGTVIPGSANRNLYNGGSEWQNDFSDLPDVYQTFYRNYDPALGRFVGVDPKADLNESLSSYQYARNNPVMYNDPLGDKEYVNPSGDYPVEAVSAGFHGGYRRIGPGSGNHWTDGMMYPDWNSLTGSDIYRSGLAQGLSDYGGILGYYTMNGDQKEFKSAFGNERGEYGFFSYSFTRDREAKGSSVGEYTKTATWNSMGYGGVSGTASNRIGGLPSWMGTTNTNISAFGVGNGAKIELLEFAVRQNYVSARTFKAFNELSKSKQIWRTANTLGKTGVNYLKTVRTLGAIAAGISTVYTVANAGMYYYNGGNDVQVGAKAALDVIMTGVGFLGPIGFGISATYFIVDNVTGGFGVNDKINR